MICRGSVAKEAEAISIDGQRQQVVEKEMTEMLKMVPGGVGRHKSGV